MNRFRFGASWHKGHWPGNRSQKGVSPIGFSAGNAESARPARFAVLLTRKACYGLIVAKHLAEHAGEGSFSANDSAEFYGLPHETLAKILQRLAIARVLTSHHVGRYEGRHAHSATTEETIFHGARSPRSAQAVVSQHLLPNKLRMEVQRP